MGAVLAVVLVAAPVAGAQRARFDTRVFALPWPRKGWAPVPDAPTEIIEGIDAATGDLVVMALQAFAKRAMDGAANEGFVPHVWTRDGHSPAARPDDVDDDDDV